MTPSVIRGHTNPLPSIRLYVMTKPVPSQTINFRRSEPKPSIRERLDDVLNKPREKLDIEDERELERERDDKDEEISRDVDRGRGHSL